MLISWHQFSYLVGIVMVVEVLVVELVIVEVVKVVVVMEVVVVGAGGGAGLTS